MKTRMNLLIAFLILSLSFQSCSKDNFSDVILSQNENDGPIDEEVAKGTISIEAFLKDPITITTGRALTLEEALDIMLVEITSTDGLTTLVSENYRDLPATIAVPAGNYNMLMSNFPLSETRFDNGVYGDYVLNFEVTAGNNTELNPVLRLLDVATTVNFSSDIVALYPDISAYVARFNLPASVFGEFPLDLTYEVADNGRRGYHSLFSGNHVDGYIRHTGDLWINISATNSSGENVSVVATIDNISSNEHYNINVELTAPSSSSLNVTLEPEGDNTETIIFPN